MINVSIVIYKQSFEEIASLVSTLLKSDVVSQVHLIDNSPKKLVQFRALNAIYQYNKNNIGYGSAHNIAIRKSLDLNIPYHLVINPDIDFEPSILSDIVNFMNNNSDIGLLMPKVIYPSGEIQYLCKLIPTPFDLIFRRFLPKQWTRKRTEKFELQATGYNKIMEVPYLSGCFMFLRTDALRKVGLFDERFFMYPEDIDLSRRIHSKFRTIFYPKVKVVHYHAKESYLNWKLLIIHITNMIKYFNKWGWIFDNERRKVNRKILNKL